jgi:hypothetical protein
MKNTLLELTLLASIIIGAFICGLILALAILAALGLIEPASVHADLLCTTNAGSCVIETTAWEPGSNAILTCHGEIVDEKTIDPKMAFCTVDADLLTASDALCTLRRSVGLECSSCL